MSIFNAVTPGGWQGLRRTPFASLTPAPPTIYFVPLSRNSYLAGPSPCPCPGVDTPPQSLPSSRLHSPDCILSAPFSHYRPPGYFLLRPSSDTVLRYLPPTSILLSLSSSHIVIATRYLSPFRPDTL
jgi:hypothetical protein